MERELCCFFCMRSTTYTTEQEGWLLLLPTQNTLTVALPDAWACFGMSMADVFEQMGQRLPLPICKTLTNQVWMAAGHPKPSFGFPDTVF